MRILYTSLLLFFTLQLFAQDSLVLKRSTDQVEATEVVQLENFPATQLYFNSTLFLEEAFAGGRESLQMKDKKGKTVAAKGSFPVVITNSSGAEIGAKVVFNLLIQCAENRYNYRLTDLYFAYTESTGITSYASFNDRLGLSMSPRQWQEVEEQTEAFLRPFISDLKEKMAQQEVLCKEVLSMHKKKSREK